MPDQLHDIRLVETTPDRVGFVAMSKEEVSDEYDVSSFFGGASGFCGDRL